MNFYQYRAKMRQVMPYNMTHDELVKGYVGELKKQLPLTKERKRQHELDTQKRART